MLTDNVSPPTRHPDQRLLATVAWAYLGFAVVVSSLYMAVGAVSRTLIWSASLAALVPAVLVAKRAHGYPLRFIWAFCAVGGLYVVSDAAEGYMSGQSLASVQAASDLLAKSIIVGILIAMVARRRGRFTAGDILDGIIIALGAWLIAWILLVQPYPADGNLSVAELSLDALYVPAAVPIIALASIFLFTGHLGRVSNWAAAAAFFFLVFGDLVYVIGETRDLGSWAFTLGDVFYIATYFAAGAALIHPTAHEIMGERHSSRRELKLSSRLVATACALIVPVMVLTVVPATDQADSVVRAASTLALLLLVGWRLHQSTSESLSTQNRMLAMARTDDLTGLPNKAALLERATDVIDQVWRTRKQPALYLFDLDRFKNINDSLGHPAGDEVLRVVTSRLRLAAESVGAVVARPSGDEFLILDTSPESATMALAHAEMLHSVFLEPISINQGAVFVTSSVGVAAMPSGHPLTADELFRRADIAMYRAKDAGRNCVAFYDESMQHKVAHRLRTETELHGALERREFQLYHQPIVDADGGRVAGFEALIRWRKDDGTMVSPAEFIPIAEETGIIGPIGSWALLEAMTQLNTWILNEVVPADATISVNVSPRQLADPKLVDVVAEALKRSGLPPRQLWVEVTESMMIENPDLARSTLERIRDLGVRIALDDFGTGYSSLSLLQQFPLHRIKIDQSFVSGMAESEHDRSLIRTIIALGESMGMDIVAEGVETVDQLRILRELGCAKAQGFLISRPVAADAMRSTILALEGLSEWPEFNRIFGEASATRRVHLDEADSAAAD